ncbi:MAG: DUF3108 domain-containing protein [Pelistega sp.]|nr:DUF3108 domain-containing protein [Pelistega sp.]
MLKFAFKKSLYPLLATSMALGAFSVSTAQAQNIDYIDATFAIGYNGNMGNSQGKLKVQRQQNTYDATFSAEHTLLDITQKARFSMQQCSVTPSSYSNDARPAIKSNVKENINFNWGKKQANYTKNSEENKSFSLAKSTLYDPLSFFFEARCDLMAGKKRFTYPIIYKGNERQHTYAVVGKEVVKTGLGDVEALIVERVRDSKSRQTRFFVAPSLDYMLVKIEHRESALAKASATLQSMNYKTSN